MIINLKSTGSRFSVRVCNGGGEEWMFHTISPVGPVLKKRHRIRREQHDEIEQALAAALDYWREYIVEKEEK